MTKIKGGRLKQLEENPRLIEDYVDQWNKFTSLKQAGACNYSCS